MNSEKMIRKFEMSSYIKDGILYLFFFFTMFFPTAFSGIRFALLVINIGFILLENGFRLSETSARWIVILIFMNSISLVIGIVNQTPGAFRCITVDFLWPILFLFFSQYIGRRSDVEKIIKIIVNVNFFVLLFDIMYLASNIGGVSIGLMKKIGDILQCNFGSYDGLFQYTTTHMCTIIFMLPFMIALFFEKNEMNIVSLKMLVIQIAMGMVCLLMSGRVVLVLTTFGMCMVIILLKCNLKRYLFKNSQKEKFVKGILVSVGCLTILIISLRFIKIDFYKIFEYIVDKFTSSATRTDIDNGVRKIQADALIEGWMEAPIFGHGTGSYTSKCIRDHTYLWAYEYTYLAMLFQKGIVGVITYFGFIGAIISGMILTVKKRIFPTNVVIPFMVGMLAIIIATAADPYLTTFGGMWMLYVPFAIGSRGYD